MNGPVQDNASVIARRFAPPRLVVSQELPDPDELTLIWLVIRDAITVIRRCLAIAACLIWQRFLRAFEARILHSLPAAWGFGSFGWGAFLTLSVIELFLR